MKHLNQLLLILFLIPFFSAGQSNYQPGYVVTLKGDTVHGFIDFRVWDSNPTAISFKSAINDEDKRTYNLDNISFFNVNGLATYKKYTCSVSMDITNTAQLDEGRDTSFKTETVFLQILQQGKNLALYAYTDGLKTRFYIGQAPDFLPVELIYRTYHDVSAQGSGNTINENAYQKQLFALANKYNALDDKLTLMFENTNYNRDDLLTIVSRINNISKTEFEQKYAAHTKFGLYASAALNISSTSSSSVTAYSAGGGGSHTSYGPAVALGFNLIPNPVLDNIEFRADISIASAQFSSLYQLKVSPYGAAKASFDQLNLSIAPQIIFNFYHTANSSIYAGAGFVFSYLNFSNPYFGSLNPASGNSNFPIETYGFNRNADAFLLKAGIRLHKNLEIYFNYISPVLLTESSYFSFYNSNIQIGVSYFFGK